MANPYNYVSAFTGIAGFDLALDGAGLVCTTQIERDKDCLHILNRTHPDVPKIGDVKDAGRHNIQTPVFLVCGGSPCQQFSVAGNRDGLAGEQSQLWYEYHRLLVELRPKWFIWENVPGVLSSGSIDKTTGKRRRGIDFAIVLAGFTGVVYSIPRNGWRNSGIATGRFYNVAWRVLDAQYWGVAQRRKRVFVVGHLASAGRSPFPVLFESARVSWHYPSRKKTRKETAASAETGTLRNHPDLPDETADRAPIGTNESAAGSDANVRVSGTERAAHNRNRGLGNANETDLLVAQTPYSKQRHDEYDEGAVASTLMGRDYKSPGDLVAVDLQQITSQLNKSTPQSVAPTMTPGSRMIAFAQTGVHAGSGEDVSPTLTSAGADASEDGRGRHAFAVVQATDAESFDVRSSRSDGDLSGTLQAKESGSYSLNFQNPVRTGLRIRRLTPVETERLQGFPDNHTLLREDGIEQSDATRYRQTGNAVAVPVIRWIAERLLRVERGEL